MLSYQELLQNNKWKEKRNSILERDNYSCQECMNKEIKKNSQRAKFTQIIKVFQSFNNNGMKNDHKVIIQDTVNYNTYETYVSLNNKLINQENKSDFDIFYSIDSDKVLINYIEETTYLEIKRAIFVRNLHVHHKYYQEKKLPWEYPDNALITLCWKCHEDLHSYKMVDWLDENGIKINVLTPCSRCYGAGSLPQYNHVENGICFSCEGLKYIELIVPN